jgi:AraC-like DNA-binding protein
MDVLSDLLGTIRLRSMVFAQTVLAPPWGISAGPSRQIAFHILARGHAWLEIDDREPLRVQEGNAVLLAPGRAHTLRDSLRTRPRPLSEWMESGAFSPLSGDAGRGAEAGALLVCGCFRFEDEGSEALISALPPVIHSGELPGDVGPWVAQTIKLITAESAVQGPGTATVVDRLCDVLFVYLLRSYLSESAQRGPSLLRALADPPIGASLRLIHESPDKAWTVPSLAARVGMSRSAFAARFADAVGETPMRYLTLWRLRKAAGMLRAGRASIAEVAAHVGYDSEASFNKAFKRSMGVAPGVYRRASRGSDDAERTAPGA